ILIKHNFCIVSCFSDRVIVMCRGEIVVDGPSEEVLRHAQHPYTKALIACIPRLGAHERRLTTIDYAAL
ncbi:MAG: ABC transporter ATP-binding protein, partial [Verrucomicrobiota bacterium JB024]|nr:ABC transporter ATP-binding protein [Verrucomicrobiota bacterium JB024]